MSKRSNWTVDDYKAEQEAVEALGPIGRAEVLAELLEARKVALTAAASSADYLLTLAKREPEAVDVLGYVRSLDARELLSADTFRVACRERYESSRLVGQGADAACGEGCDS